MGKKTTVRMPHQKDKDALQNSVDARIDKVLAKLGDKASKFDRQWDGYDLMAAGKILNLRAGGELSITDDELIIKYELPWVLTPMKDNIITRVEDGMRQIINSA